MNPLSFSVGRYTRARTQLSDASDLPYRTASILFHWAYNRVTDLHAVITSTNIETLSLYDVYRRVAATAVRVDAMMRDFMDQDFMDEDYRLNMERRFGFGRGIMSRAIRRARARYHASYQASYDYITEYRQLLVTRYVASVAIREPNRGPT